MEETAIRLNGSQQIQVETPEQDSEDRDSETQVLQMRRGRHLFYFNDLKNISDHLEQNSCFSLRLVDFLLP